MVYFKRDSDHSAISGSEIQVMEPHCDSQGVGLVSDSKVMTFLEFTQKVLIYWIQHRFERLREYWGDTVGAQTALGQMVLRYHQEYLVIQACQCLRLNVRMA